MFSTTTIPPSSEATHFGWQPWVLPDKAEPSGVHPEQPSSGYSPVPDIPAGEPWLPRFNATQLEKVDRIFGCDVTAGVFHPRRSADGKPDKGADDAPGIFKLDLPDRTVLVAQTRKEYRRELPGTVSIGLAGTAVEVRHAGQATTDPQVVDFCLDTLLHHLGLGDKPASNPAQHAAAATAAAAAALPSLPGFNPGQTAKIDRLFQQAFRPGAFHEVPGGDVQSKDCKGIYRLNVQGKVVLVAQTAGQCALKQGGDASIGREGDSVQVRWKGEVTTDPALIDTALDTLLEHAGIRAASGAAATPEQAPVDRRAWTRAILNECISDPQMRQKIGEAMDLYLDQFQGFSPNLDVLMAQTSPAQMAACMDSLKFFGDQRAPVLNQYYFQRDIQNIACNTPYQYCNQAVLGCQKTFMSTPEAIAAGLHDPAHAVTSSMTVPMLARGGKVVFPTLVNVVAPALDNEKQVAWKHYVADGKLSQTAYKARLQAIEKQIVRAAQDSRAKRTHSPAAGDGPKTRVVLAAYGSGAFLSELLPADRATARGFIEESLVRLTRTLQDQGFEVAYTDKQAAGFWTPVCAQLAQPPQWLGRVEDGFVRDGDVLVNAADDSALLGNGGTGDNSQEGFISRVAITNLLHAILCQSYACRAENGSLAEVEQAQALVRKYAARKGDVHGQYRITAGENSIAIAPANGVEDPDRGIHLHANPSGRSVWVRVDGVRHEPRSPAFREALSELGAVLA